MYCVKPPLTYYVLSTSAPARRACATTTARDVRRRPLARNRRKLLVSLAESASRFDAVVGSHKMHAQRNATTATRLRLRYGARTTRGRLYVMRE